MTISYYRNFLPAVVFALAVCIGPQANAALVYDNTITPTTPGASGLEFTSVARADDFTLSSSADLTGFRIWAAGSSANSDVNTTIGYAIYNDNAGAVGSLITSGSDAATIQTDTGTGGPLGPNYLQIDGVFSSTVSLGAGTYWVTFRDGAWGTGSDGSQAYWLSDSNGVSVGYSYNRWDSNISSPSFGNSDTFGDIGFQLTGTVPEPSSFVLAGIGLVGLAGWGIRRRRK